MPTEIYKTLTQLNILFQALILEMLGYEMTGSPADYDSTAYAAVRVSWPTEGAPAFKIDDDIVFVRVLEEDSPINRQRDVELTDNLDDDCIDVLTTYTRVISLYLVLYGPNSFDNAQLIRDRIFEDGYRLTLAESKIYPIPDIVSPRRAPEAFQGRWWERTDLEIRFNEGIARESQLGYIESVEIDVIDADGVLVEVDVSI